MRPTALLLLVACNGSPSEPAPAPALQTEAGVPPQAAPTRTVGHRNPLGDVIQRDNLMVDGDFELTGRSDQAPWIVYNQGQQTLNYDTGGRCRSGVRCGVIGPKDTLVGWFASPAAINFVVRLYMQTDTGRCADATVLVVDLGTDATIGSVSAPSSPGADGWCAFEGQVNNAAYLQPALYVALNASPSNKAMTLHVDQGSVLPQGDVPIHAIKAVEPVLDARLIRNVQEVSTWIRAHRKYGRTEKRSVP